MVEIPEIFVKRLAAAGTKRFIRVSHKNKNPIDQEWQKTENQRYPDDIVLKAHLQSGGNYGVVGGRGLIIVDADTLELDEILEKTLPPTFKVMSPGSGLPHRYYLTDLDKPLRLRNNEGVNIGDIQGPGKQVLGPKSIHPNGKPYEITDSREIAFVGEKLIRHALGEWLIPEKEIEEIEAQARSEVNSFPGLSILNVVSKYGIQLEHKQGDEFYGIHPTHGSSTGRNFWINTTKNVWHCFRCSSGGGPLSLVAVLEGVISCEGATKGALRNAKYRQVLKAAIDKQLLDESQLKKDNPSESENGERFFESGKFIPKLLADEIQRRYRFIVPGLKTDIYRYREEEGIWFPDGEIIIRETAAQLLADKERKTRIEEVIACIKNSSYVDRKILGKNETKFVVKNGVLNLETHELEPFNPEIYAINALPVKYDPEKKCPAILKFVDEVAPEDKETLQEWVGYHLLKAFPYDKCLMLLGDGANGKSTFLSLLGAFLGDDNYTCMSLTEILGQRFAVARLYGKLANIAADISPSELKRTGKFKWLTGGDRVEGEKKFQEAFYFYSYGKLSFSANQLPPSSDQSQAFFRRWLIVNFPNKFEDENCDPTLLHKLTSEDELSGFLNWALEGLRRIIENKGFTKTPTTEEMQAKYEELSDPVTAFISNCLEVESGVTETKDSVYNAYYQFCRMHGFPYVMKNILTKELKPKVPIILGIELNDIRRNKKTSWQNLRLRCSECQECREKQPPKEKIIAQTLDVPPLCEECNQPITDGSHILWKGEKRVCSRCAMFLKKTHVEKRSENNE